MEDIYNAYKAGEGCRLMANLHLNFLGNSFMIGFSNLRFMQYFLTKENKPPALDFEHKILEVYFGAHLGDLARDYADILDLTAFNSLKDHGFSLADNKESLENDDNSVGLIHNYFLQVIPNDFTWFMHWVNCFQYTVTHHSRYSDDNGILFMFELSPVSVKYFREVPSVFDFLVQISSVVGGVFMFLKVVDMYLFNIFTKVFGSS